ncbi:MAG: hypothetical protein JST16_13025 [Bdellovibrionales bacterium]|nr:hypothetical protein [Bdellovibrionales bacterium]
MKVAARTHFFSALVAGLLALSFAPHNSSAKDLSGRFGIGVANINDPGLPPALSLDWHVSPSSAFEFNMAIDTDSTNNNFSLGSRYWRHIFIEENAFFSAVLGGGLLSQQVDGSSKSGYYLECGAGSKFFLPGLPNLAGGFVGTIGVRSAGAVRFLTQALFSIHYYF